MDIHKEQPILPNAPQPETLRRALVKPGAKELNKNALRLVALIEQHLDVDAERKLDQPAYVRLEKMRGELLRLLQTEIISHESQAAALDAYAEEIYELLDRGTVSAIEPAPEEVPDALITPSVTVPPKRRWMPKWLRVALAVAALGGAAGAAKNAGAETPPVDSRIEKQSSQSNKFARLLSEEFPEEAALGEIDPRYTQIDKLQEAADDMDAGAAQGALLAEIEQIKQEVKAGTGWANKKKQDLFRFLLKNQDIRARLLQEPDLTMADGFSLIKAAIANQGGEDYITKLERAIITRAEFKKAEFMGPATDKVIIFNYAAKDAGTLFDASEWVKLATAALGDKAKDHPEKFIKVINTGELGDNDAVRENATDRLAREIEESPGNVVLILNTHGSESEIATDLLDAKKPQTMSAKTFALALLNRLAAAPERLASDPSGHKNSFKAIINACKGSNFFEAVHREMRQAYSALGYDQIFHQQFSELPPLTAVSLSEDYSPVVKLGVKVGPGHGLTSPEYLQKITAAGKLDGSVFLELQPLQYEDVGDMKMMQTTGGKMEQFSYGTMKLKANTG